MKHWAAQEAGTQHCEYIDRKKENAIFMHSWLHAAFTKQGIFFREHTDQCQNSTLQISAKSPQAFPRYETSKIGFSLFLFFHLFAHLQKLS